MTRDDIISAALEQIDTPFRHQGRVPGIALDCAGLYVCICQRLGIPHQDATGYPSTPFDGEIIRQLNAQPSLVPILRGSAEKGDVLVMRMSRQPQHIAIHAGLYRGHPYVVHASSDFGGVRLHRMDSAWFGRVTHAYRFTEVE